MILPRVCFLVALTLASIEFDSVDATLVELLNNVKNELMAQVDVIKQKVDNINVKVDAILHHVSGTLGHVVNRQYIPLAPTLEGEWASSNRFPVSDGFVAVQYRGLLLLWGGRQRQADKTWSMLPTNIVYIYDQDRTGHDSWEKVPATGDIPKHSDYTADVIIDDDIYVFGGERFQDDDLGNDIYHLRLEGAGESRKAIFRLLPVTGNRPSGRRAHGGWSYEKKLFFFGGVADKSGAKGNLVGPKYEGYRDNLLVQFDPETNEWTALETKGPRPSPRSDCGVARLGDEVIIHGGWAASDPSTMFILHMPTLTWTRFTTQFVKPWGPSPSPAPPSPSPRLWAHSLTPISTKKVLIVGGWFQGWSASNQIYIIDLEEITPDSPIDSPDSAALSTLAPFPQEFGEGLVWHRAVGVKGETGYAVFCLGGYANGARTVLFDHMIKFDIE